MDIVIRDTTTIPPYKTVRVSEATRKIEKALLAMKPNQSFLIPKRKTYGNIHKIAKGVGCKIAIHSNELEDQAAVYLVSKEEQ